ncbi:MAG: hypothetical protein NC336_08195 [Clostridium sp.]|nr:hypothetical protein [Clostridium sp.]
MESYIETLCREKEQELLDKYFGNLDYEENVLRPETIGDYSPDLPLKIEEEFREFLAGEWKRYSDEPLVLEEQHLRWLMTEDDREAVEIALDNAERRTLWERVTRSNHEDVALYKRALRDYTRELLTVMRVDFLEEITGNKINCKNF